MQDFITRHADLLTGSVSCFDRIVFKGHLPLNWPGAMERLLRDNDVLIGDFKHFVNRHSNRLKGAARQLTAEAGRPWVRVHPKCRKEDVAREIAERDAIDSGLVCVLTAVEACNSFKVVRGDDRPYLRSARRKCLCLYFYFVDDTFGMLHVRLTTWFPFMIQICMNGHSYLARRLVAEGIAFERADNVLLRIDDCDRAQKLADTFIDQDWPGILSRFAHRVNPLLADLLAGMTYYWVIDQAEYATDIMFRDPAALKPLYEKLLKHALECLSAEDVMTFLGRKLHSNFAGELVNYMKKRWPGARVKHRMKKNWIKMYDKHGMVLRVETVINHPYEFKVRRHGKRNGQVILGWFPMAKGVANLYRYADVCRAANARYLSAMATVPHPRGLRTQIASLARRKKRKGRSYRALNPLAADDLALFAATLRGEYAIHGFQNRDIRLRLFGPQSDKATARRQAANVSRRLKLLHVHGLIARIPRTRRWRVSKRGHPFMSTAVEIHRVDYPELILPKVA